MSYYTGPLNSNQGWAVAKDCPNASFAKFGPRHIKFAFGPYATKKEAIQVARYQHGRIELFINCTWPQEEGPHAKV